MYAINISRMLFLDELDTLVLHVNESYTYDDTPYSFNELVTEIEGTDCGWVMVSGIRTPSLERLTKGLQRKVRNKYVFMNSF